MSALSQGTLVADATKARLAADPTAPDPEQVQVTFYEFGNPNREGFGLANLLPVGVTVPLLNYTVGATPESQYDNVVVYAQYEGWADFPNRPWKLVRSPTRPLAQGICTRRPHSARHHRP